MPKGLKLTFPDGRMEAVVWPDGVDPECIMEERGASLVDPCDSLAEAQWKIDSDPTGKA